MWDSIETAWSRLQEQNRPHWSGYAGFYSSWLGGFFKEPWAMMVPMDDHGFHRGDGVFEAVRIHERAYFDLDGHLQRVQKSASLIGMHLPWSFSEMQKVCVELARRCDLNTGILRLYITRGPGGFSPNPAESVGPQLYAAITRLSPPNPENYKQGVRAMLSTVPAKDPWYAQIKSLNYLQNVLMKQECVKEGYDIAVCADPSGRICEGATENLLIVNAQDEVVVPRFDYTLRGTTVRQVMKIAEEKAGELGIKAVRFGDLTIGEMHAAKEAAFVGTTLGVLPIRSLGDHAIGLGRGGPIALSLNTELMRRMSVDPVVRTPF